MRTILILFILAGQLFTIRIAEAADPFILIHKKLPCNFESYTYFTYEKDGKIKHDLWTQKGGFIIMAGEYIITNNHVGEISPEKLQLNFFSQSETKITNVKINRVVRRLYFCSGEHLNIKKAVSISSNPIIDYAVYRLRNKTVESHTLPVPILDEHCTASKLTMPGKPGGLGIRKNSRTGIVRSPANHALTRISTSITFNPGDSGHPVFTTCNDKLFAFGIGVEYYLSTGKGIVLPLSRIANHVLRTTNIDLIALHNTFLTTKKLAAAPP